MLEDAVRFAIGLGEPAGGDTRVGDGHDLARLDLAVVGGADGVEGDGLTRCDVSTVWQGAQDERPPPPGITREFDPVVEEQRERKGPAKLRKGPSQRIADFPRLGEELEDDFCIAAGVERAPLGLEFVADLEGVDDVAVVRERNAAPGIMADEGLGIGLLAAPRRGVAGMPDGSAEPPAERPVQTREGICIEYVGDEPEIGVSLGLARSVPHHDAGGLLPPVLERKQTQVRLVGGARCAPDGEYATLLLGMLRIGVTGVGVAHSLLSVGGARVKPKV